ncbi:MAG: UDP-3-O-acyl-N-acetylglucosamine deacetylase [Deltaproteobacteria bacterium]|nr:UDP-3-O-acyl-N-acetylglucosamine deacetylase [Deltaproteobacteria bacterium]
MYNKTNQKTIANAIVCKGIGLHSGEDVFIKIKPAPVNHGIRFIRKDLPNYPEISSHFNMVIDTTLATVLGNGNGAIVSTIEHLMACFSGLGIDNAVVETNRYEIPIMDGSAAPFVEAITKAEIVEQNKPKIFFIVNKPIILQKNQQYAAIYPNSSFKITCSIQFDHPLIKNQSYSLEVTPENFINYIAKARTFGFLNNIQYMKQNGLAKGGSLDNAVVIDENGILNKEGLRFKDEFVRHKILDCLGDFSLIGMPIIGHIKVHKSGHAFNHLFLKKIFEEKKSWETKSAPV